MPGAQEDSGALEPSWELGLEWTRPSLPRGGACVRVCPPGPRRGQKMGVSVASLLWSGGQPAHRQRSGGWAPAPPGVACPQRRCHVNSVLSPKALAPEQRGWRRLKTEQGHRPRGPPHGVRGHRGHLGASPVQRCAHPSGAHRSKAHGNTALVHPLTLCPSSSSAGAGREADRWHKGNGWSLRRGKLTENDTR